MASVTTDVRCTRHSSTLQLPSTESAKFRTQTCVWSKFSSSPSSSCPNPSLLYFLWNDDVSSTQLNTGVLSNKETYSPMLIPSSKSCQQAAFSDLPCPLQKKTSTTQGKLHHLFLSFQYTFFYYGHSNTAVNICFYSMKICTALVWFFLHLNFSTTSLNLFYLFIGR